MPKVKSSRARRIRSSRLFVNPNFAYLAASPDGLIGDDGIVKADIAIILTRFIRLDGGRYEEEFLQRWFYISISGQRLYI
ncbi:hypothetical protein HNY73_008118 [Argiope bruennichi]|uniref:Uncharacterized protein n=1 Tax=Argiope bruennichi TaxID=94029 RepID=A0A8T0F5K1_ARGBR|nr:hypothetical protein HNY73_008118 [Argiope bruennichi]